MQILFCIYLFPRNANFRSICPYIISFPMKAETKTNNPPQITPQKQNLTSTLTRENVSRYAAYFQLLWSCVSSFNDTALSNLLLTCMCLVFSSNEVFSSAFDNSPDSYWPWHQCCLSGTGSIKEIQSIFIILRFHICKFVDLLKFVYNPQISIPSAFKVIHRHAQNSKNLIFPADIEQSHSGFSVSIHTLDKYPFCGLFSAMFSVFLLLLLLTMI